MPNASKEPGNTKEGTEEESSRDDTESLEDDESGSSTEEDEEDDEEDEEDDEPKLKYARLTGHLGAVYRNGDATSAFLVAGDKMSKKSTLIAPHLSQLSPRSNN